MKENVELDVFFRVYFTCSCLLMHLMMINRYYGSMSLRQLKYQLRFALTAIYTTWSFSSIFPLKLLETDERIEQL